MSEERLSSNKLDIEGAQRSADGDQKETKESYKQISEDIALSHVSGDTVKNSNMVRENGDFAQDGADEKMLGSDDKETLALKNVEVKFISGDQNQNGDAKIDIGAAEKTFTGMTKEELMKYANDPFWVKLRWVLFIFFWALWIAMLVGAIAIIVYAPKCAAPTPLVWWKKGPLIDVKGSADDVMKAKLKEVKAQGVIYELDAEKTYRYDTDEVKKEIKDLIDSLPGDIHLVLDLTANYVSKDDELFKSASSAAPNEEDLGAFVTVPASKVPPNTWKKLAGGSAWKKEGDYHFLSQFGDNYDLQFSSEVAQQKLIDALLEYVRLGVKGFRLSHAKHFIIDTNLQAEDLDREHSSAGDDNYAFYFHKHSTNQPGLGSVIHKFTKAVHNATKGEGFLSVRDDMTVHHSAFLINNTKQFAFDLPNFRFLNRFLEKPELAVSKKLHSSFDIIKNSITLSSVWMQVNYESSVAETLGASAYNLFMNFLPGAQIASIDALKNGENKTELKKKLDEARESPVFQHGNFDFLLSQNDTAFAYTRIKSGNPGYFVAFNPTDDDIKANFTSEIVGTELSVLLLSEGFSKDNPPKGKISTSSVPLAKKSVAVFTFVPKS